MKNDWLDRLDPRGRRFRNTVIVGQREIDRDEANEWLLRVKIDYQRNLAETVVIRYMNDMNEGFWIPGSQLIAFDGKGNLINGQHVLSAFARSELKKLDVIWEINKHPHAYTAFDTNRKRTASDTLKWNGVDRPGEMQRAATALWQYETGCFAGKSYRGFRSKFPSASQVQQTVKTHPGLEQHLWKNPFRGKELSVGALDAGSYILSCLSEKHARDFYDRLIEGVRIPSRDHPVAALRRAFMNLEDRQRNGDTLAFIFKAWNAFIRGEEVTGRLLRKDEAFPEPLSPDNLEPIAPGPAGPVM